MTPFAKTLRGAVAAALLGATLSLAPGGPAPAQETVSAAVGKPVQAAQAHLERKRYKSALAQLARADKVKGKTRYEAFVIDQTRAAVYQAMGRHEQAAKALEEALASGQVSKADRAQRLEALAQLWYRAGDYTKSASYGDKALAAGKGDDAFITMVAQAHYQAGGHERTAEMLTGLLAAQEKARREPDAAMLQLLAAARYQVGDTAGYADALREMVAHHPSPEAWSRLVGTLEATNAFPDRLDLDLDRLKLAAGLLRDPAAYGSMAQDALAARLPGEAVQVVEKGFAAGVLGQGPAAERHERLRAYADQQAATQRDALPVMEREAAAAASGDPLAHVGMAKAGLGDPREGAALLAKALAKGDLSDPSATRLRLGVVQLAAGQRDAAEATLAALPADTPEARLGSLWLMLEQPQS